MSITLKIYIFSFNIFLVLQTLLISYYYLDFFPATSKLSITTANLIISFPNLLPFKTKAQVSIMATYYIHLSNPEI